MASRTHSLLRRSSMLDLGLVQLLLPSEKSRLKASPFPIDRMSRRSIGHE
jgi:hypothetical protein